MRAGRAWFFLAAAAGITRAEISPNREAPAHPIEPSVSELGVRSYVLVLTAATKHDDRVVGGIICCCKSFQSAGRCRGHEFARKDKNKLCRVLDAMGLVLLFPFRIISTPTLNLL